jgi:hypothetical protein
VRTRQHHATIGAKERIGDDRGQAEEPVADVGLLPMLALPECTCQPPWAMTITAMM